MTTNIKVDASVNVGDIEVKINNIEYVRKDSIDQKIESGESLYKIGRQVVIRTVTFHYIGVISYLSDKELVLDKACWLADSGRWNKALNDGEVNENEMFIDPVSINRDTIVDCTLWRKALPTQTK